MRKKRPLKRVDGVHRNATLVVITSEDRYAVKQYLDLFKSTHIQFRVLETDDGHSSPEQVMAQTAVHLIIKDLVDQGIIKIQS